MGKATHLETALARKVRMKPVASIPNLRSQQRVGVSAEIAIEKPDGTTLDCRISNLSRSGVMISCSQGTAKQLLPGLRTPAPGTSVEVKTRFAVPVLPTQTVLVIAEGKVMHMRRIARDEFQVGIQFCEFEGNGFDYVDRYVAKLLADARSPVESS